MEDVEEDEEEDESDDDDDAEFELAFVKGLQELISHHLRAGNYPKAIEFINQAMSNSAVLSSDTLLRTLQCQLALARLLQGQWRLASSLLTTALARLKKDRDAVVCSLLHGLAVAHLTEYAFDDALTVCKMALYGRRRLQKKGEIEATRVHETVGLFAAIYDMTGDFVRAEVLRGQLPPGFHYMHPESAMSFLLQEDSLKNLNKGEMAVPQDYSSTVVPGFFEMPDRDDNAPPGLFQQATTVALMSPLRSRICEHERLESDTAKEVLIVDQTSTSDADDEASPITEEEEPEPRTLHRRLTQIFRSGRPKHVGTKLNTHAEEAADDSGYGTASPVEDAVPTSPWRLIDFGIRRSKTKKLIKRHRWQPAKREKPEFKLLSMESRSKVEGPGQTSDAVITDTDDSMPESRNDALPADGGADLQLAELDATTQRLAPEGEAVPRGPAALLVPAENFARFVKWANAATAIDEEIDLARSPSQTRATLPSKLKIPYSTTSRKVAALSLPSLDPRNLTHERLSPRLNDAISCVSRCLAGVPQLKTSEEMDATWTRLHFALEVLKTRGVDKCLEGDVEAAMRRLERRSWRLKKAMDEKKVTTQRKENHHAVNEEATESSEELLAAEATDEEQQDSPSTDTSSATGTTTSPEHKKALEIIQVGHAAQEGLRTREGSPDCPSDSQEDRVTMHACPPLGLKSCEDVFDEGPEIGEMLDEMRIRMLHSRKFSFELEVEDMAALRKRWREGRLQTL
ncbi:hypothetical protein LIA77_00938 [Sarocladium implicatum]|nr:hypothetical protein LIA77_00938 [Sarocladium implicatum]